MSDSLVGAKATEEPQEMWKYAIVGVLITICLSGFGRMSYGVVMPFMKESLFLSYRQAGMLATGTALGYLAMVMFVGIMAAKWGSKRLVVIGMCLLTAGMIALFFVQSYLMSLISMTLLGVGTAFGYTPLVNIIVGWFPRSKGVLIGFLLCGMGLGTLIASVLIPILNGVFQADGWRYLWLLYAVISAVITLVSWKLLEDPPVPLHKSEKNDQTPLRKIYVQRGVMLIAIIYGLMGLAYLIPQSFLFSYILESGISEQKASFIVGMGGLFSIFSGPIWGAISDKIGRKKALIAILFLCSTSILFMVLLPNMIGFIISQFLWGFTLMGMLSLIQALSTEQTTATYAPVVLGYVTIYFAAGQMLGPGIGGLLIDTFGGIPAALWLCFFLFFAAFILTFKLDAE